MLRDPRLPEAHFFVPAPVAVEAPAAIAPLSTALEKDDAGDAAVGRAPEKLAPADVTEAASLCSAPVDVLAAVAAAVTDWDWRDACTLLPPPTLLPVEVDVAVELRLSFCMKLIPVPFFSPAATAVGGLALAPTAGKASRAAPLPLPSATSAAAGSGARAPADDGRTCGGGDVARMPT